MIFAILPTCWQRKITLTYKSNPELSIVVCSKKDKSAININLNFQSYLSLYYTFIKPDTPNNFNYSSIQYRQKWTNYTGIINYISCIVCYVFVDRSMEKRDKKEIASWILNQISIGIIQTFVFFSVEYFASYQYNVWFLSAKVPGHSVTNQKKKQFHDWSLYNLKLTFFAHIFSRYLTDHFGM